MLFSKRHERGAVALEAILSVMLMLGAFYTMWGASIIVFNKTKLTTATQFSSRGAMVVYDDQNYRGASTVAQKAATYAAARTLVQVNTLGMALDQFSGTPPVNVVPPTIEADNGNGTSGVTISCSPSTSVAFNGTNCTSGNKDNAHVTRIIVRACSQSTYWLLSPLQRLRDTGSGVSAGDQYATANCTNINATNQIKSTSRSFSFSPDDAVSAGSGGSD